MLNIFVWNDFVVLCVCVSVCLSVGCFSPPWGQAICRDITIPLSISSYMQDLPLICPLHSLLPLLKSPSRSVQIKPRWYAHIPSLSEWESPSQRRIYFVFSRVCERGQTSLFNFSYFTYKVVLYFLVKISFFSVALLLGCRTQNRTLS